MCRDVFHAFLVEDAEFDGIYEIPKIKTSAFIPQKLVPFSKAMAANFKDYDCWGSFYEEDARFERLWNNPKKYLQKLKKFQGIISPDFSMYRDMPFCMQLWNTYRSRALAAWLQKQGVEIIPNVRYNDSRTYDFCFDGIEKHKTIAIGTHGCIKRKADRLLFQQGLYELVKRLRPKTLIVCGAAPKTIFQPYIDIGIEVIAFESEFAKSRKQVTA